MVVSFYDACNPVLQWSEVSIIRNTALGISCLRGKHYSTYCCVGVKNARIFSSTSCTCLHCDVFRHKLDIRRCWAKLDLAGAVCFADPQSDFDKCWETELGVRPVSRPFFSINDIPMSHFGIATTEM